MGGWYAFMHKNKWSFISSSQRPAVNNVGRLWYNIDFSLLRLHVLTLTCYLMTHKPYPLVMDGGVRSIPMYMWIKAVVNKSWYTMLAYKYALSKKCRRLATTQAIHSPRLLDVIMCRPWSKAAVQSGAAPQRSRQPQMRCRYLSTWRSSNARHRSLEVVPTNSQVQPSRLAPFV